MENQINVGDQNRQQVGQNPINQAVPTPEKPKVNYMVIGAIVLVCFVVFGFGGYYLGKQSSNNSRGLGKGLSQPTPYSSPTTIVNSPTPEISSEPTTRPDKTSTWNTYTSTQQGFSIKYPKKIDKYPETWQHEEYGTSSTEFAVGFGTPSSKSGGYIWGVWVYENKNMEDLIKQMGNQFADRKESRQNITVSGVPAVLVTVTTNQYNDWVSKNVYIKKGNKIYSIGNGAIELSEFDDFYKSFKFLP